MTDQTLEMQGSDVEGGTHPLGQLQELAPSRRSRAA